jgi:hypothetical protein
MDYPKLAEILEEGKQTNLVVVKLFEPKDGQYGKKRGMVFRTPLGQEGVYNVKMDYKNMWVANLHTGNALMGVKKTFTKDGTDITFVEFLPSNDIQVSSEAREIKDDYKAQKEKDVISMIVHGFMAKSLPTCTTVEAAVEQAEEAYYAHKRLVEKITSGVTSETLPSDISF